MKKPQYRKHMIVATYDVTCPPVIDLVITLLVETPVIACYLNCLLAVAQTRVTENNVILGQISHVLCLFLLNLFFDKFQKSVLGDLTRGLIFSFRDDSLVSYSLNKGFGCVFSKTRQELQLIVSDLYDNLCSKLKIGLVTHVSRTRALTPYS